MARTHLSVMTSKTEEQIKEYLMEYFIANQYIQKRYNDEIIMEKRPKEAEFQPFDLKIFIDPGQVRVEAFVVVNEEELEIDDSRLLEETKNRATRALQLIHDIIDDFRNTEQEIKKSEPKEEIIEPVIENKFENIPKIQNREEVVEVKKEISKEKVPVSIPSSLYLAISCICIPILLLVLTWQFLELPFVLDIAILLVGCFLGIRSLKSYKNLGIIGICLNVIELIYVLYLFITLR